MKLLGVFRVCSQAVFMTCSVSTTQHKVSRSAQTSTTSSPSKSEIRDEQQRSKRNNSHGAVYLDAADMFLCNSAKRCRLAPFVGSFLFFPSFNGVRLTHSAIGIATFRAPGPCLLCAARRPAPKPKAAGPRFPGRACHRYRRLPAQPHASHDTSPCLARAGAVRFPCKWAALIREIPYPKCTGAGAGGGGTNYLGGCGASN